MLRMPSGMTIAAMVKVTKWQNISTPLLHGKPEVVGSISRVPAHDIEDTIVKTLQERLEIKESKDARILLQTLVERVEIQTNRLVVMLKPEAIKPTLAAKNGKGKSAATIIHIPWTKPPTKRGRDIVLPAGVTRDETSSIKAARRAKLIASIAKGRRWLDELVSGQTKNPEEIAKRERCSVRKVNMTISLALLAPTLVKAAVGGNLPRGITASRLYDLQLDWSEQFRELGLSSPRAPIALENDLGN